MHRVLMIVGAGVVGVIALWLALVWFSPAPAPTTPVEKIGPSSTMPEVGKRRDLTERPNTPSIPRTVAPPPEPAAAPPPAPPTPTEPDPPATLAPDDPPGGEATTAAPATDDAPAAAQPEGRFPKGSLGCTRYKTYDAQTQTYRGFDGVVRPCRPQ